MCTRGAWSPTPGTGESLRTVTVAAAPSSSSPERTTTSSSHLPGPGRFDVGVVDGLHVVAGGRLAAERRTHLQRVGGRQERSDRLRALVARHIDGGVAVDERAVVLDQPERDAVATGRVVGRRERDLGAAAVQRVRELTQRAASRGREVGGRRMRGARRRRAEPAAASRWARTPRRRPSRIPRIRPPGSLLQRRRGREARWGSADGASRLRGRRPAPASSRRLRARGARTRSSGHSATARRRGRADPPPSAGPPAR